MIVLLAGIVDTECINSQTLSSPINANTCLRDLVIAEHDSLVRRHLNPLALEGSSPYYVILTNLSQQVAEEVRTFFSDKVYELLYLGTLDWARRLAMESRHYL